MTITDGYPVKPLTERRRHNNAALMDTVFDIEEKGTTIQQTKFDSREITNLQQKKGRAKDAAEWRMQQNSFCNREQRSRDGGRKKKICSKK